MIRRLLRYFLGKPATLRSLGFPSYDQLESVGLSRAEFMVQYVHSTHPRWREGPEGYSQRCLAKFWSDYPQLLPAPRPENQPFKKGG